MKKIYKIELKNDDSGNISYSIYTAIGDDIVSALEAFQLYQSAQAIVGEINKVSYLGTGIE